MKIERLILEPLDNNCYILSENNCAIIIDSSSEENKIEEYLTKNNLTLISIFITHYHFDHIGALDYFIKKYNVKVYDYKQIGKFKEGPFKFQVISTKGHSNDSVSFYFEDSKDLFVGDFIFEGSIGRMDLEGGDEEEMSYSLRELKKFDKNTKIYPGHGNTTTLSYELLNNPYL